MSHHRGSSLGQVDSAAGKSSSRKLKKQKAAAAETAAEEVKLEELTQPRMEVPSPTQVDQEDGVGSEDSDNEKELKQRSVSKPRSTQSQWTDNSKPPKYSTTGGLYGNTTMPTTMPQMSPKLGGQTYEE